MPKNAIYTSNRTKHPEQTEHHRQDAYLLTQRQAETHQDAHEFIIAPMHKQEAHQMHSTKATPEEAPKKTAKGTAIETTPEEPGTPNAKGTVKATAPPAAEPPNGKQL